MRKASTHCPNCHSRFVTLAENAGRSATCRKCAQPFVIHFEDAVIPSDDVSGDDVFEWISEKMEADGDASDNLDVPVSKPPVEATLVMDTRYCPECGGKAEASRDTFATPLKCPKCSKVVTFFDYPNDPPATFKDAIEPNELTFDYSSLVAVFGISFVVFILLLMVPVFVAAISASILLAALSIEFLKYRFCDRNLKRAELFLASVRKVQEPMAEAIRETQERYHGFARNYNKLVRDKEHEFLALSSAAKNVCDLYIRDCVKWIMRKLTVNNYHARQTELEKVIQRCRKAGYTISARDEKQYMNDLLEEYRRVVAAKAEKEEQARIKAHMREEKRREQQIEQRMKKEEAERRRIEEALAAALKEAKDEHNSEVEELRKQLEEANAQSERTKSMAEQTKAGHVYVISNVGSFGEGVFKVGMTRRLDPGDRVKELGDASVPFPFDVHAMISCDDAPTLEKALHHELRDYRVNKVNFRKEFFRVDVEAIINCVGKHHGTIDYVADPEALEYNESRQMTDDEMDIVEAAYGV